MLRNNKEDYDDMFSQFSHSPQIRVTFTINGISAIYGNYH